MTLVTLIVSIFLFVQSIFSVYLMLYSWEHPEKLAASQGPRTFLPPQLTFSVLLPARHEQAVIYDTIKRVWETDYPSALLEIRVICHSDDQETIAEAQRAINDIGSAQIQVATFSDPPINKPHGLNVGLRSTANQVVTIFDAEDDIDKDIFNVINTIMLQEKVGIVQAGVQLMNFRTHWYAIHNCIEYFFWFKSRLHFHAKVGMIPLGGNTVFFRRDLLERVGGWDEACLTEDADIGLRLSVLNEPIRVVYDVQHVTREETPPNVGSFIRQRTRWQQGFLQVLAKGTWLAMPRFSQKLLAFYTLSYPLLQAALTLLWIPALLTVLWMKLPVWVAMVSFLPLYSLFFQFIATVVGAYMFTREYGLRFPILLPLEMALSFLPYQWLIGISSVRVLYRTLLHVQNWEKTEHVGAHRISEREATPLTTPSYVALPKATTNTPSSALKALVEESTNALKAIAKESAAILKDSPMEDTLEMRILSSDIFLLDSINNADETPTLLRPAIHSATPRSTVPARPHINPETPIPPCIVEELNCPTVKLSDDIAARTHKLQDPVLANRESRAQQQGGKER